MRRMLPVVLVLLTAGPSALVHAQMFDGGPADTYRYACGPSVLIGPYTGEDDTCERCTCQPDFFFPTPEGVAVPSNIGGIVWVPGRIVEPLDYNEQSQSEYPYSECGSAVWVEADLREPVLYRIVDGEPGIVPTERSGTSITFNDPYKTAYVIRPVDGFEPDATYRIEASSYADLRDDVPDDCSRSAEFQTGGPLDLPDSLGSIALYDLIGDVIEDTASPLVGGEFLGAAPGHGSSAWEPFLVYRARGDSVGGDPSFGAFEDIPVKVACGSGGAYSKDTAVFVRGTVPGAEDAVESERLDLRSECGSENNEFFGDGEFEGSFGGDFEGDGSLCSVRPGPRRTSPPVAFVATIVTVCVARRIRRRTR
ncbi:MAG: hypothetical protein R3A78_07515 [Polyangiales bacterium]